MLVGLVAVAGVGYTSVARPFSEPGHEAPTATPSVSTAPDAKPSASPDTPTGWGPTLGEMDRARKLVGAMSDTELAGQVIVGRYHGTSPDDAAGLVSELHLAGVCVTSDNVVDRDQVEATTKAVEDAVAESGRTFPAVIGVDQEGGVVSHLRDIAADYPSFRTDGEAVENGAVKVVRSGARAQGLELRQLGFTWVFAPVADVTIGAADPTIGTRSASEDPQVAARTTVAADRGLRGAGIVPTVKHFPGHGSVTTNSHETMPIQEASLAELRARDLVPFKAAIDAGASTVMMAHIETTAIAPGGPASLRAKAYEFLRRDLGFRGLVLTDSLGMGAVASDPDAGLTALRAGADLLLMPADTAQTHQRIVDALADGRLPRQRIVDAATRVVAMQLWQQRAARAVVVPEDAHENAERAAEEISSAAR